MIPKAIRKSVRDTTAVLAVALIAVGAQSFIQHARNGDIVFFVLLGIGLVSTFLYSLTTSGMYD